MPTDWEPDLANPVVWINADSISGVNDQDPLVSWSDLSGNSNDFAQGSNGTTNVPPTYRTNQTEKGGAAIDFSGSQWMFAGDIDELDVGTGSYLFICLVKHEPPVGLISQNVVFGKYGGLFAPHLSMTLIENQFSTPNSSVLLWQESLFTSDLLTSTSGQYNPPGGPEQFMILGAQRVVAETGTSGVLVNGQNPTLVNPSTGNLSTNTGDVVLGAQINGGTTTKGFRGQIVEWIALGTGSTIDTTTRQKLEGYLAHKHFNTPSNILPAGHPYRFAKPKRTPAVWTNATGDNSVSTSGNWSTSSVPTTKDAAFFTGAVAGRPAGTLNCKEIRVLKSYESDFANMIVGPNNKELVFDSDFSGGTINLNGSQSTNFVLSAGSGIELIGDSPIELHARSSGLDASGLILGSDCNTTVISKSSHRINVKVGEGDVLIVGQNAKCDSKLHTQRFKVAGECSHETQNAAPTVVEVIGGKFFANGNQYQTIELNSGIVDFTKNRKNQVSLATLTASGGKVNLSAPAGVTVTTINNNGTTQYQSGPSTSVNIS